MATTTRRTPASMIRLVHGPVRPVCAHGSSVQYSVAAARQRPGLVERVHLGVRFAGALVRAVADAPRRRR